MEARLELEAIACIRGECEIFRDVNLRLGGGEALELRGANGCGKTSLLRIIAGLLAPSRGRVTLRTGAAPPCYLAHENALKGDATAEANLLFWAAFLGAPAAALQRAVEMLRLRPLLPTPVAWLSVGQRRRLALARLCLSGAGLWLLDEPVVGLDEQSRACLGALLAEHRREGGLVVAATHADLPLPAADRLCLDAKAP